MGAHRNRRLANTLAKDLTWLWAKRTSTHPHPYTHTHNWQACNCVDSKFKWNPPAATPPPPPLYYIQATQKFEAKAKTSMCHKADDSSPGSLCVRVCVCVFGARHVYSLAGANNVGIDPKPNPKTESLGSSCKTQLARCQFAGGAGIEASTYFIERYWKISILRPKQIHPQHTPHTHWHTPLATRTAYCDLFMFAKALRQRVTPSSTTMSWGVWTSIGSK